MALDPNGFQLENRQTMLRHDALSDPLCEVLNDALCEVPNDALCEVLCHVLASRVADQLMTLDAPGASATELRLDSHGASLEAA